MNTKPFSPKTMPLLCAVAVLLGGATYAPVYAATAPVAVAKAASATTVFKVPTMTCGDKACATAIYLALHRLKGVEKIQINDMARTVTVLYDPKDVSVPTLLHTFTRIGYPASVAKG